MRHKGNTSNFIPQRDRELLQAYRRAIAATPRIIATHIWRQVADAPASRFWVSTERALAVIPQLLARPQHTDGMLRCKAAMFRELTRRVALARQQHTDTPLRDIIFNVVHSPAPHFYLTPRSVATIISRLRRQLRHK